MLIFIQTPKQFVVVPENKIQNISVYGKQIVISYSSGEIYFPDNYSQTAAPKIEVISVIYETPDDVLNVMRNFYKASVKNEGAFFFKKGCVKVEKAEGNSTTQGS